jgi:hypothetical protein
MYGALHMCTYGAAPYVHLPGRPLALYMVPTVTRLPRVTPPPCVSARLGVGQARGGDVWAGLELGPDPDWVWDGAAAEDAGPTRAAGRTSLTCHACGLVGAACVRACGSVVYQWGRAAAATPTAQ